MVTCPTAEKVTWLPEILEKLAPLVAEKVTASPLELEALRSRVALIAVSPISSKVRDCGHLPIIFIEKVRDEAAEK
jgi:hypothetical protein